MEQLILSLKDNVLLHAKKEYAKSHYSHISGSRLPGGKGSFFQSHLDNYIIKAIEISEMFYNDINPNKSGENKYANNLDFYYGEPPQYMPEPSAPPMSDIEGEKNQPPLYFQPYGESYCYESTYLGATYD